MQGGKRSLWGRTVLLGALLGALCNVAAAERWLVADSSLDALDALLDTHVDDFGGFSVDPRTQRVVVRVVADRDRAYIDQLLADLPSKSAVADEPQWSMVLQPVARSTRTLQHVRSQVVAREPWINELKPVFAQVHIDVERNVVAVGVTAITPQLQRAAQRAFGSSVELYVTERYRFLSRLMPSTTGSLAGGSLIRMPSGRHCTSGFAVRMNGTALKGFTTAGHCVMDQGMRAKIGDVAGGYLGDSLAHRVGHVAVGSAATWPAPTDAAVVLEGTMAGGMPAEPRVYVGDLHSTERRYVVGSRGTYVGQSVCFNGAKTGENCNVVVVAEDVISEVTVGQGEAAEVLLVPGLIEARSADGSSIAQPGDSGGPVYVKEQRGAMTVIHAVGAIEAGPVPKPSPVAVFVPMDRVVPIGYSLWTANCSLTSCTAAP